MSEKNMKDEELRRGNLMARLTQKITNKRFVDARKLVFDETHPDKLPKTRLVLEVITGLIVFRLLKGLVRLVELGLRLFELVLENSLDRLTRLNNMVNNGVKNTALKGLVKVATSILLLVFVALHCAVKAARLVIRAIISPIVSFRYASSIKNKWGRRLAQTASMLTTIGGWVMLSMVAFPWLVSQVPGLLPILKPLIIKVVVFFHFSPVGVLPTLAMMKTAAIHALWTMGATAVAGVVVVSSLLHAVCNNPRVIKIKHNIVEGFKTGISFVRGLISKKQPTYSCEREIVQEVLRQPTLDQIIEKGLKVSPAISERLSKVKHGSSAGKGNSIFFANGCAGGQESALVNRPS